MSLKKFEIAGVDTPCVDLGLNVDKFPKPNRGEQVKSLSWQGGGKVSSGMVAAARLGAKCAMLGTVGGDDYGQFCIADFQRHGIDTSGMIVRENCTTSLSVVLSDKETRGRSILGKRGTAKHYAFEELDKSILEDCEWFFIANCQEDTVKAAKVARAAGARVLIDADGYTPELMENLDIIDAFVASEFVYDALFQDQNYEANCKAIFEKGPSIVVFTFGPRGCVGYSADGYFEMPTFEEVEVVDTVGAGDVFHGAFLAGLLSGWDAKETSRFASAVSSIKCTRIGGRAGIPNRKTVLDFMETGKIDYTEIDQRVEFYGKKLQV